MPASALNPNNVVVIRAWYPTNYGQAVSYPEAWLRRTFTPDNNHAHIGHLAMSIGDLYISLMPTESHLFATSPAINNTLEEDIKAQENLPPTKQVVLFSLDTQKMVDKFKELQKDVRWFLFGNNFVINPDSEHIYNCSSYVEELLNAGGLYDDLLSPEAKLGRFMTPQSVFELAERAAAVEAKRYADSTAIAKVYAARFATNLLAQSENIQDPCKAVNDFLEQNSDFYLRVNQLDPKVINMVLPVIYANIQNHLNQRFLKLAKHYVSEDATAYLSAIEMLLRNGATLSAQNAAGYNALHLMINNNSYGGVEKILNYLPQAANANALAFAKANGHERITALIQKVHDTNIQQFKLRLFPVVNTHDVLTSEQVQNERKSVC